MPELQYQHSEGKWVKFHPAVVDYFNSKGFRLIDIDLNQGVPDKVYGIYYISHGTVSVTAYKKDLRLVETCSRHP